MEAICFTKTFILTYICYIFSLENFGGRAVVSKLVEIQCLSSFVQDCDKMLAVGGEGEYDPPCRSDLLELPVYSAPGIKTESTFTDKTLLYYSMAYNLNEKLTEQKVPCHNTFAPLNSSLSLSGKYMPTTTDLPSVKKKNSNIHEYESCNFL